MLLVASFCSLHLHFLEMKMKFSNSLFIEKPQLHILPFLKALNALCWHVLCRYMTPWRHGGSLEKTSGELEPMQSLSPPSLTLFYSLSLSYLHLFSCSFVFISALYVWFFMLAFLVLFLLPIFSVFLSAAPARTFFILGSPCLASSRSVFQLIACTFIPLCLLAH